MATIKKNWLRAGISLFVLLLGVFYIVKAREMEDGNKEASSTSLVYKTYHYLLDTPTGENNPNNWAEGPALNDVLLND